MLKNKLAYIVVLGVFIFNIGSVIYLASNLLNRDVQNPLVKGENTSVASIEFTPQSQNEATFYFETDEVYANQAQEFWSKVVLDTCVGTTQTCVNVSAASLKLYYDASELEVLEVQTQDYQTQQSIFNSWAENSVDVDRGTITVSGYGLGPSGPEPFSGQAAFISIHFRAVSNSTSQVLFDSTSTNAFWAEEFNTNIVNLGEVPNPVGLTVFSGGVITLDSPQLDYEVGEQVAVNILINSAGSPTVASDVVINYPEDLLEFISFTPSIIYESYQSLPVQNGIIDTTGFSVNGTEALDNALYATLTFETLAAGNADITVDFQAGTTTESNILVGDADILVAVNNLSISVSSPEPSATPTPTLTPTPTPTLAPTATPTPIPDAPRGDLNNDFCVNGSDVAIMIFHWGWIASSDLPAQAEAADLDRNGKINGADIAILVASWGGNCAP